MNEKFFAQVIAELQTAQADAMAMLTTALCMQVDPGKLKTDLKSVIAAYQKTPRHTPTAVRLAQSAQAAAQAQEMLQANDQPGASRPK